MEEAVPTPQIETSRLLLREWRAVDRAPFAALNADPRVCEHLAAPLTRAESDDLLDRIEDCWREHGYGLWAVERLDRRELVGFVGLWPAEFDAPFTPAVEVGWRLAPQHWGLGFATEAGVAALRYAFDLLALPEIVSFTAAGNVRSRRVMERLGLAHDVAGDFDHPELPGVPHVLYRVTQQRWRRVSRP